MTAAAARRPGLLYPGQMQRLHRPGVQVAVLPGVLAWGLLCALPLAQVGLQLCAAPAPDAGAAFAQAFAAQSLWFQPVPALAEWGLMVVAMMLPLTACEIDHLRARTFRCDRGRVTGAFTGGFLVAWMFAAPAAIALTLIARAGLQSLGPAVGSPAVPLILAAFWMLSGVRRRALARGHYRPSGPAGGRAAVRSALVYGLRHARDCMTTCLPLMLAMQVAGGGLAGMAVVTVLAVDERRAHRPDPRGSAVVLAAYGFLLSMI